MFTYHSFPTPPLGLDFYLLVAEANVLFSKLVYFLGKGNIIIWFIQS